MATTEKFQAAKERMRAAKAEAAKIAQDAFKDGAAELFAAHPKLDSFGWQQYTPYFNDGDECVFSARTDYPNINGEDSDDLDALRETIYRPTGRKITVPSWRPGQTEERDEYENVPNASFDPELKAASDAVTEYLGGFDGDDFKEMFGDHMEITVSRDGSLVAEEYSHD